MDFLQEDGYTLNRLMAHGALSSGELESMGDLVREIAWVNGIRSGF